MNQNLKTGFIRRVVQFYRFPQLAKLLVVLCCLSPAALQAQNDLPLNINSSGYGRADQASWQTPPARMQAPYIPPPTLNSHDASGMTAPTNSSWPDQPVSFESQVEQAASDSEETVKASGNLPESPAAAISWTKDFLLAKTGGLLNLVTNRQQGKKTGSFNITKMLGSLAIVLGGYFAFVWIVRKISPSSNTHLPANVVQVLGRTPFGPKQHLQLVKLGSKLVLLINGPEGTHPVGEITDPVEVEQLLCQCKGKTGSNRNYSGRPVAQANSSRNSGSSSNETINAGLANILRSIENAAKQHGGSVFEA